MIRLQQSAKPTPSPSAQTEANKPKNPAESGGESSAPNPAPNPAPGAPPSTQPSPQPQAANPANPTSATPPPAPQPSASSTRSTPAPQGELDAFASDVLNALLDKQIPPLPSNFGEFFERMLKDCDGEFQKKIHLLLDTEPRNSDRHIKFEKNIHLIFGKTKELLRCISGIYKNFVAMTEGYGGLDSKQNAEQLAGLQKLQLLIDHQVSELKNIYQECNQILETINISTMYDLKFDVFNKRYFIQLVQEETTSVQRYSHASSIIMLSLSNDVMQHFNNEQSALAVTKTIAKILLKTSRRSDMIGYIGQGIFAMLLRHSDIESSKKASERLVNLVRDTNIFLGNNEIGLDINVGISKITGEQSANESLNHAIAALHLARKNKSPFVVYKDDDKGA